VDPGWASRITCTGHSPVDVMYAWLKVKWDTLIKKKKKKKKKKKRRKEMNKKIKVGKRKNNKKSVN
jgi:hypothetical protein